MSANRSIRLFYTAAGSVALRSDCAEAEDDQEQHCLNTYVGLLFAKRVMHQPCLADLFSLFSRTNILQWSMPRWTDQQTWVFWRKEIVCTFFTYLTLSPPNATFVTCHICTLEALISLRSLTEGLICPLIIPCNSILPLPDIVSLRYGAKMCT